MTHDLDSPPADLAASAAPPSAQPAIDSAATSSGGAADPDPNPWRRRGRAVWTEWIKPLSVIALVMFSFRSAVADWNDVPTGSMKPTILEGDRIFVNKVAYDLKVPFTTLRLAQWDDPLWGDVVVLRSPEDGKRLVKRVVGLPGDVLEIRGKNLVRNGEYAEHASLDSELIEWIDPADRPSFYFAAEQVGERAHAIMVKQPGGGRAFTPYPSFWGPYVVPDEHYFVMGDNRSNSKDSRTFGTVHRSQILGEATAVALSLDREQHYRPRWDRFFSRLH